jgi:hypothetical protein
MSSATDPGLAAPTEQAPDEPRRRHLVRWLVLVVAAVLVVLALDAAWAIIGTRRDLQRARSDLTDGASALIAGQVAVASDRFVDAADATAHANGLLNHPAVRFAGVLPWVGDNVTAVRRLTEAASLAADSGTTLVSAADRVDWRGGSLQGLFAGSGSLAGTLHRAAGDLHIAASKLNTAEEILAGTPTHGLLPPIRNAVIDSTSELAGRATLLDSATDIADVVPALFEPGRRYLLVVQNPDEPRGTGGFMGYFGFLRSERGKLHLGDFFPAPGTLVDNPVHAPADFRARYQRFQALVDLRQANFTPDFPTAAGVVLQMARQLGWGDFDGIILVDPVWMKYMLEAIGPIDIPAWNAPISSDNVLQVLGHDVFQLDEGGTPAPQGAARASDVAQGQIGRALWDAMQTRDVSGAALATGLSRATAERHLQMYSVHPREQAGLSRLGMTGQATLHKNPLYVVWIGLSANKAAWFAGRTVDVHVALAEDGTATVTTTLHLSNGAPKGGPAGSLLGSGTDFPIGTWASEVSVYQPERIAGIPTYQSSGLTVTGQEREFGHPVSLGFVWAAPGRSDTWSVTYEAPNAVTSTGDLSEYRLDFIPQPTLVPIPLSIKIDLPEGASISSVSPGMQIDGGTTTYSGQPTTEQSMWVRFS